MKKVIIAILIILAALLSVSAYQNNPQTILKKIDIARLESQPKQLIYKVYFLGIFPLGKALIEDNGLVRFEGKDLYLLSARAGSDGLVSKLYPFSAHIDSYLELKTFLPAIFIQQLKTKDKEIIKEARYDQANNIMEIAGQKRNILPETYEPLSALCRLRSLDLEKISNFDLNVNNNQKNYAFSGDITKEEIRLKDGTAKFYRLKGKIFRRDKNPYHQSQVEFVLLGNKQRIPVFIRVFASGALITARLTEQGD